MNVPKTKNWGKIKEMLPLLQQRPLPLIDEKGSIKEIIEAYAQCFHSRLLYVVDKEKKLMGIISLGNVLRHVFFHYHKRGVDTGNLISMAVSEHARDFIEGEPIMARADEDVEEVLQRMIRHNAKEIPIVDERQRVIADLTMVDILQLHNS